MRRRTAAHAFAALVMLALIAASGVLAATRPAGAATRAAKSAVTRREALAELRSVRASIDQTLALAKRGDAQAAFEQAKAGYLNHFERVEIPLRVVAPSLTTDAETKFAEIRNLISAHASAGAVRARIVELRKLVDDAERRLTDTGVSAPAIVASQSFLIIFREGLEAVLLISVLLGYLEAAKATRYRAPILWGMALGGVGTVVTFVALRAVLSAIPVSREMLEAITAIIAVVVLFYVSFWLVARLEHKRWLEFLKTRVWTAVSLGSVSALVLIGFTAVYREGFETALFYQSLLSFGRGLAGWIALGLGLGIAALVVVAFGIFRLGRRVPVKTFLSSAVILLMATSVAFLGNAVHALQEADVVALHPLAGWPRPPIFLAEALGFWGSRETVGAQVILSGVYIAGALYMFVIRPRRQLRTAPPVTNPAPARQPAGASAPR